MGQFNKPNATYLTVSEGKFISACEKGKHNIERTADDGTTKYGFATNAFESMLTNITIEPGQYGKQFIFHWADDDGTTYKMPMKYGSNLANSFLNSLAGVVAKHGKMVSLRLTASAKVHNGKTYTNIFINDRTNENIKWKYDWKTDIPAITRTVNKRGDEIVDDEARLEFFDKVLENEILPALRKVSPAEAKLGLADGQAHTPAPVNTPVNAPANDDDDIPF